MGRVSVETLSGGAVPRVYGFIELEGFEKLDLADLDRLQSLAQS